VGRITTTSRRARCRIARGNAERFRIVNREFDAAALLVGERRARGSDVLFARVEGVDVRGVRRRERGEPAASAADVEHTLAV